MSKAATSLIDRAGLDRPRLAKIISRGLDGAGDGELFLEYRQAEVLMFDNGRLKQATYDTSQGFGLRAVKDEAVGYAHASDVSEAAIERAVQLNQAAIIANDDAIRAIAAQLHGPEPVYARGLSRVELLLTDGTGPLCDRSSAGGALAGSLGRARAALRDYAAD